MGRWEEEEPMLPVKGARSEVVEGSSGSMSIVCQAWGCGYELRATCRR